MYQSKLLNDYGIKHAFLDASESEENLLYLQQIHSFEVVKANETTPCGLKADALVTNKNNIKLTLKTADCAPVLLADVKNKIIGAAHAGWKGALTGVIETTIIDMCRLGANVENIVAAIGPCIHAESYPVSDDMMRLFTENVSEFFETFDDGQHFNLPAYVEYRLKRSGVRQVDLIDVDTYTDMNFNSYRRNPENPNRQFSFIYL